MPIGYETVNNFFDQGSWDDPDIYARLTNNISDHSLVGQVSQIPDSQRHNTQDRITRSTFDTFRECIIQNNITNTHPNPEAYTISINQNNLMDKITTTINYKYLLNKIALEYTISSKEEKFKIIQELVDRINDLKNDFYKKEI